MFESGVFGEGVFGEERRHKHLKLTSIYIYLLSVGEKVSGELGVVLQCERERGVWPVLKGSPQLHRQSPLLIAGDSQGICREDKQ